MNEVVKLSSPEVFAGILLFLATLAIGIQKLIKINKSDRVETDIIDTMHEELSRLSSQNGILAGELNKLQLEVIKLTKEIHTLTVENQQLHLQISQLTNKVLSSKIQLNSGE